MGFQLDVASLGRRIMSLAKCFKDHKDCLDFKLGTPEGYTRQFAVNNDKIDKLHEVHAK